MAAPIMILRARGPQDTFLTVEPEITFWKTSHSRHTNFALEDNYMTERTGTMNFGGEMKFPLQRTGDLVTNLTLHMEVSEVKFNGTESGSGFLVTQNGHAVGKVFADDLGRALIDYVELTIGHYKIEKLTGDFMHIQDRMMRPKDRSYVDTCKTEHGGVNKFETHEVEDFHGATVDDYYKYLFPYTQIDKPSSSSALAGPARHDPDGFDGNSAHMSHGTNDKYEPFSTKNSKIFPNVNRGDKTQHIYIPLQFSNTSNNHGQALPVIALQYHNVEITVKLRNLDEVSVLSRDGTKLGGSTYPGFTTLTTQSKPTIKCELLGRYVFLDDYERRLFATSTHEFLITETSEMSFPVESGKKHDLTLHFNHPTKALYTFVIPDNHRVSHENSTGDFCTKYWNWVWNAEQHKENESIKSMNLKINGQNLYSHEGRDSQYFGWLLPAQVHSRVPDKRDRVYVMPFCLEPESWKPTGSINMSRLDTVILSVETTGVTGASKETGTLWVYSRNFNILKITSGMGGKRFAS